MLQIKNTVPCPRCQGILRVSVRVVSDGKEYEYYLCPKCQDVARLDPKTGTWRLSGATSANIAEIVQSLQALAVEEWRAKATDRSFAGGKLAWTASGPPAPASSPPTTMLGPRDKTVTKGR